MDFELLGVKQRFGFNDETRELVTSRTQLITDDFKNKLADERLESRRTRSGEYMKVASIPAVFVEAWMNDKKNPLNVFDKNTTLKMIMDRLRSENLEAFLATTKRVA